MGRVCVHLVSKILVIIRVDVSGVEHVSEQGIFNLGERHILAHPYHLRRIPQSLLEKHLDELING